MSFDVVVLRPDRARRSLDDIHDAVLSPLGSPDEVRARCNEAFPGLAWSGDVQGLYTAPSGYSVEFSIPSGQAPSSLHLSLHFGPSWDDVSDAQFEAALRRLFRHYGWQAFAVSDNSAMSGTADA